MGKIANADRELALGQVQERIGQTLESSLLYPTPDSGDPTDA